MDPVYKLPRLYVETLSVGGAILTDSQWHYLKNVLRCRADDAVRVFSSQAGEYRAVITNDSKRPVIELRELLRRAVPPAHRVHLYVPPLPKDRFDFLIEKATELGMTDYHPLITDRTTIRTVNEARLRAQAIEAAEQCERMDIPVIHKPVALSAALDGEGSVYAALERLFDSSSPTSEATPNVGSGTQHKMANGSELNKTLDSRLRGNDGMEIHILIGPAGGWAGTEQDMLLKNTTALDLGERVLRSETAALAALVRLAPR